MAKNQTASPSTSVTTSSSTDVSATKTKTKSTPAKPGVSGAKPPKKTGAPSGSPAGKSKKKA